MTNTLIGEQISRQINFFAANIYRRFFFVEETYDHVRGNGRGSSFTDMQILDDAWKIAERNSTTCEWIFHQLAAKNLNVNAVQWSIASVIRYSRGKKKL